MEISTRNEKSITIVSLTGRLDAVTAPDYEKSVRKLIDNGSAKLVMDMSSLDYISSAGLRGLLMAAKLLKTKNGAICLSCVQGGVREVLKISGFGTIFTLYDSVETALDALS